MSSERWIQPRAEEGAVVAKSQLMMPKGSQGPAPSVVDRHLRDETDKLFPAPRGIFYEKAVFPDHKVFPEAAVVEKITAAKGQVTACQVIRWPGAPAGQIIDELHSVPQGV